MQLKYNIECNKYFPYFLFMKIELLSPAKNLECGIGAIDYGADAVYIGASKFGARSKAANPLEDIEKIIGYAHKFDVKVYPVLNTILYENELEEAEQLIHDLYKIKSDAIIIQDMAILEMQLPPIPLFASTQTNNYSLQRIKFLEDVGLKRIILARELSLNQIKEIRANTSVELEFFIHGALCVSFSGQCFFSEAVTHRSANRGECSQPCRMRYDLIDSKGHTLLKNKNILSLKDLNLSDYISQLIDSGINSFKIEGRLKDSSYVKNITAFYRKTIDEIIANKPDHHKSSSGNTRLNFEPAPDKSFNRSFTSYYINNSKRNHVASIHTEKSIGEVIGKVKTIEKDYITLDSFPKLNNGDGICFFSKDVLSGTNVNKVQGNKIFLNSMDGISTDATIFRNSNIEFDKFLKRNKLKRKITINFFLEFYNNTLSLTGYDDKNNRFTSSLTVDSLEKVSDAEFNKNKIEAQLKKTGESIFNTGNIEVAQDISINFPLSLMNKLRREVTSGLENQRLLSYKQIESKISPCNIPFPESSLDFSSNVINSKSREFYKRHGVTNIEPGFELLIERKEKTIMTTKYCIRFEIGKCPMVDKANNNEPLFLLNNNQKYRLEFNCKECQMKLILC
jgi:23S rRNA 5-hydroxycytidine C2501 synthase